MTDEERDKCLNTIKAHCSRLADSGFTTVHIFASKYEGVEGTSHWSYGDGDYLSRYGQICLWIEGKNEEEREGVRKFEK